MKLKLIIPLFLVAATCEAQNKPYLFAEVGTSSKLKPVVAMYAGLLHESDNRQLKPFLELGLRTHIDNRNIAYGSLNGGFELKNIGFSCGVAYGGNIGKDDNYFNPETGETTTLLKDVRRGKFISPVASIRYIYSINDNNFFFNTTYCQKVLFAGIGIKAIIGE